jgi:hypothetical protein
LRSTEVVSIYDPFLELITASSQKAKAAASYKAAGSSSTDWPVESFDEEDAGSGSDGGDEPQPDNP